MPRLEQVGGSPSVAHAGGGTRTATWKGTCGGTGASSSSPFITCAARTGARSAPLGVRRHTTDRHHPLIGYHRNATSARRARGRARTASSPFGAWPCTACAKAAARVRDRDAWGRTPAGRLRTTLPRPCRARHALRDCATSRRGAPAPRSRRSFGLTKLVQTTLRKPCHCGMARRRSQHSARA